MYILTIGTVKKAYKRLGNAMNALWRYYNKTLLKDMQDMRIVSASDGRSVMSYTREGGFGF